MSNYTKLTDFASKDALPSGNAAKIVKGTEIDDEFEAIETAIATKANSDSPALTGTPTAPTAAASTSTTQIATTAMVQAAIGQDDIISEDQLNGLGTGTEGQVITSDGAAGFAWGYGVPAGAVMSFAMSTAPTGWLECNGTDISRTTYADLFAAIGTTYGSGDGSTTFTLPDLRGEFIRGWDNGRGVDSGRVLGDSQSDQNKSHRHDSASVVGGSGAGWSPDTAPFGTTGSTSLSGGGGGATASTRERMWTGPDSDDGSNEGRPRNIAMMYCIKV